MLKVRPLQQSLPWVLICSCLNRAGGECSQGVYYADQHYPRPGSQRSY